MTDEEKAQFDAKEKELNELKEKLAAEQKRVEDSQAMIHKQSDEVGEARKASVEDQKKMRDLADALVEANKSKSDAQEAVLKASTELAELKAKGPDTDNRSTQRKDPPKTTDELVDSLTPAEEKKLEEAWENADEDTRKAIKGNDKLYREFVSQAKDAVTEEVKSDLSTWRNTPVPEGKPKDSDDTVDKIRELFKKQKQSTQRVPPGPSGGSGAPKAGGGTPKREVRTSVDGW